MLRWLLQLIISEEIASQYRRYMDGRYADVHDGKFRKEITEQWKKACAIADEARKLERESRGTDVDSWHLAFDKWRQIMPIAEYFVNLGSDETVLRAHAMSTRAKLFRVVELKGVDGRSNISADENRPISADLEKNEDGDWKIISLVLPRPSH